MAIAVRPMCQIANMAEKEQRQPKRSGRQKDARGKRVTLLDPYLLHRLRRHDVIPAVPLAEVAGALGSGLTRFTRPLLFLGILCSLIGAIAFVGTLVQALRAGRMVWPLPKSLLLANVWVVPFVIWVSASEIRSRRIRSVMLRHVRCPHCGYDLRLLPADSKDGATVCPECGSAWKLDATKV